MKTRFVLSLSVLLSLGNLAPAFAYDLTDVGAYRVVTTGLNCRYGPDVDFGIKEFIPRGEEFQSERVVYDEDDDPWFWTDRDCYVRADSAYLQYIDDGEDIDI
ncbi:MAG: hypothetical protein HC851_07030 [Acaryochloris sp. RU_4_1]|nr:hypothetical protein [Acaryochloris sp. RU_4_1]NJN37663.1 hypothetical protein [Acaryochloridaceae cyanobacterium CSU_3_4]NJR54016.1 hypothetical protein [Acaryochloris sp. CRU_2_0]